MYSFHEGMILALLYTVWGKHDQSNNMQNRKQIVQAGKQIVQAGKHK
jgi:hypothetical protein